ncbi:MAG: GspE/PulE family protein [Candidatus Zixiibacteriota bacterium]
MAIKRLGEMLIEKGLIERDRLGAVLQEQETSGQRLGEMLVSRDIITEDQLLEVMSERLKTPKITLDSLVIDPQIIQTVPVELARRYTLLPVFRIGKTLTVAMADPLNIIAIDELSYNTGCQIRRAIASERAIKSAIERYYSVQERLKSVIGDLPEDKADAGIAQGVDGESGVDEAPVVQLVHMLIGKAVREGASDIHIEPSEVALRVRFRLHGRMREEASPPKSLEAEIISRIKIASEMDVSEKRIPQDGRFSMEVDGFMIDLRVSTLPTSSGEKIVIRILDPRSIRIGLQELGFTKSNLEEWQELIRAPEGLALISGPTSSGKTTTLYSSLQEINSVEKNIVTVEDPVEYSLPLINQVQTNERAGLTFASSLRSILRQNPDIIMIGEIRDGETASIATRAALTGHLVFSTIHTNDAASSVTRLVDIGVESYLVASALRGALAQRLVRLNCPECLIEYQPPAALVSLAGLDGNVKFFKSKGCAKCKMTMHMGMSALYEFLLVDDTIREMIARGETDSAIKARARANGMETLFEAGLRELKERRINLEELLQAAIPDCASESQRIYLREPAATVTPPSPATQQPYQQFPNSQ